jgi:hypothetical protein
VANPSEGIGNRAALFDFSLSVFSVSAFSSVPSVLKTAGDRIRVIHEICGSVPLAVSAAAQPH